MSGPGRRSAFIPPLLPSFGLGLLLLILTGCGPRVEKAAWLVRTHLDSPERVTAICREAREAGFDSLMVQVRGRGDAYYRSRLAPPAEQLADGPADYDPLAETIGACAPLPIHAWLNVYLLWSAEQPPRHFLHPAHPDFGWILKDADGRPVTEYSAIERALGWIEGIYADPASPLYRELFAEVAVEAARRYPVAGIHLDYLRYPGSGYGQAGELGDRFAEQWGLDPRWLPLIGPEEVRRWLSGTMPLPDRVLTTAALLWAETRAVQVTELVRLVRKRLRTLDRPVPLSAAVFPDPGQAFLAKGQDWRTWSETGLVDAIYPMVYYGGPERVIGQLREIREAAGAAVQVRAGLGAYLKEPGIIRGEAAAARQLGLDGICLFDLGSLAAKPGGSRPYVEAVAGRKPVAPRPPVPPGRFPAVAPVGSTEVDLLKTIAAKALGGLLPPLPNQEAVIAERWGEFLLLQPRFPELVAGLAAQPQLAPAWVELRGIFRYRHHLDGEARSADQLEKITLARQRLEQGEDFAAVAKELSQGGSRNLGGVLARRWLAASDTDQPLASLAPGELSPVMETDEGFWCYQVMEKGGPEWLDLQSIPWPARRLLLREQLARVLPAPP